jgi:predicted DNA-binding protein
MKYQIYLNKDASELLNQMAKADNKKPATLIKELMESMLRVAKATFEATERELKDGKE